MYVEQIYTGCLAEAAYYIESNGKLAPLKDEQGLDIWRNRIFAKHGYKFKNEYYTNIFND